MAEAGLLGPLWVVARRQTQGVGRRGRFWVSDEGNLFATGLFPHQGQPQRAALLSFVAAVAIADVVDQSLGAGASRIKWPNDVLVGGEKIAGILLETGTHDGQSWVSVGIGINLASAPEIEGKSVTCLARHGVSGPPTVLLETLIQRFAEWKSLFVTQGFAQIRAAWQARAFGLGQPVTIKRGHEVIEGLALELAEDGALLVRADDKNIKIHAGEVIFQH